MIHQHVPYSPITFITSWGGGDDAACMLALWHAGCWLFSHHESRATCNFKVTGQTDR
jgi:hypothetical protein